jgi:hypothetical protein
VPSSPDLRGGEIVRCPSFLSMSSRETARRSEADIASRYAPTQAPLRPEPHRGFWEVGGESDLTGNEQKQQLSVAYVHAVAARAGYACQVLNVDMDSVDVVISASGKVHDRSVILSPRLAVQLKASSSLSLKLNHLMFPLPRKNYDDLRRDTLVPLILVVLMLPKEPAQWLELTEECMISRHCAYWTSLRGYAETRNSRTVSVRLPRSRLFSVDQVQEMMSRISRQEDL